MGMPLIFQAVPEPSSLLTRLQTDRVVGSIFANLYAMGAGPYTWAELDDLDESLHQLAEDGQLSRADVDRAMADLLAEFEAARISHTGLDRRWLYLDKSQHDIEETIVGRLQEDGEETAVALIRDLFHGNYPLRSWTKERNDHLGLAPEASLEMVAEILDRLGVESLYIDSLRLIPGPRVKLVSDVFDQLDGESLFGDDESLQEDYQSLRNLCLESAQRVEALIVGV